jgi:hypothetical protein
MIYSFVEQVEAVLAKNNRGIPNSVIVDTWFRASGAHLEPVGEEAISKIQSSGFEAVTKFMKGDYFWHPDCAKCPRCWNHRPEVGKGGLVCNRCSDALDYLGESK